MKKTINIFILLFTATGIFAQRNKDLQLEDSIFSWKAIPALNPANYPRTFTPAQLKLPELFARWLQKTYIPIGALDYSVAIAEPNKKDESQPYSTGINAAMWRPMWDKNGANAIKQPHSENSIFIITNNIIDADPLPMLTTPGKPVFIRRSPDVEKAFSGSNAFSNKLVGELHLEKHPQIGKYIIQYFGCDGTGCQPLVAVYLAPNNKLPVRQLTRGEVLDICEQAIPQEAEKAREKIKGENRAYGTAAQQKWVKNFDEETLPRWKTGIEKLRNKYSSSLHKPAEMNNSNGIRMINFFNGDDIFATEDAHRHQNNTYGIYTYENEVLQKSKQDQPLWICISWKPTNIQYTPYEIEIHRSMTQHFNFDYVYNYFFRPDSVKNKPYTILHETIQQTHLASYTRKKESKPAAKKPLPANVFFREDFSGNNPGQKPQDWYIPSVGDPSVIATPKGETGNWIRAGQHKLMPNYKNTPLPENFKMEFDVATEKDFTENTGGAFLLRIHNKILTPSGDYKDAPKQVYIDLDAKAGNEKFSQNPAGHTRFKVTFTGMNSALRYADIQQFNNDFSNRKNKVHFTITKKGKKVSAFIDGKEIIALDKYGKAIPGFNELPAGTRLTSFYFENTTNQSSNHLGIYFTNIEITALQP